MSKVLDASLLKIKNLKNAASKFGPSAREGARLLPSPIKDEEFQVNSQATSPGLKAFIAKNSIHGKLATAKFKTDAPDQKAELSRVLEELGAKAKQNLK